MYRRTNSTRTMVGTVVREKSKFHLIRNEFEITYSIKNMFKKLDSPQKQSFPLDMYCKF